MVRGRSLQRIGAFGLFALGLTGSLVAMSGAVSDVARADRITNDVAVFSALDKVTARISRIEVPLNQTHLFGSLKVTPRVCYSRPSTERPKTTSFVEVDEIHLDGTEKRLFSGWMFAESPGLNAVEHPVFDVWLIACKGSGRTAARGVAPRTAGAPERARGEQPPPRSPRRRRRRVRR